MLLTVPYSHRAVDCLYEMCQAGAREYFRKGCKRLQSSFDKQERGKKRLASAGYHNGDPTCMCHRCDSSPSPDLGGTLAIHQKDGDNFSCGCWGGKIVSSRR